MNRFISLFFKGVTKDKYVYRRDNTEYDTSEKRYSKDFFRSAYQPLTTQSA